MPRLIAQSKLNASTLDILNVIRANASLEYQNAVPEVQTAKDIRKVGQIIYGTPALANQFINALVNRIAIVRVQSATFNNPYRHLKKGFIEYGETVEDIFVGIANVIDYSAEKGAAREFKRTMPDVKSAFHIINWRVLYPVTIQDEDLKMAFLSMDGVQNLIAKIIDQVYTAAEYDEFLLFKYLMIKAISHGKMYPVEPATTALDDYATEFRATSNIVTFLKDKYNEAGVKTNTPKERQCIFMDSTFNAQFDVKVLSAAFNMEKAEFMGRLHLIDDWTTFDNERFETIRANSDNLEEVTAEELTLLQNVKAVICDENWFQVYDNKNQFTEKYVASGLYWNYFYHTWKTVSSSPFSNAIVVVAPESEVAAPATVTVEITAKDISDVATVFTLGVQDDNASLANGFYEFIQTEDCVKKGIAVQKYGAIIFPVSATTTTLEMDYCGSHYKASTALTTGAEVGATLTFNKQ